MPGAVLLVDATYDLLTAAADDSRGLGALLSSEIAEDWLDFPEALPKTLQSYAGDRGAKPWGTIFFVLRAPRTLIGWGGFKGPPADGAVEIGYAVAPQFQGRGLATQAAQAMITRAFADPAVSAILAHTLAEENPSTSVLKKCGFARVAELVDPEDGAVWRWRLERTVGGDPV